MLANDYKKINAEQARQIFDVLNLLDREHLLRWLAYGEGMAMAVRDYRAAELIEHFAQ